MTVTPNSDHLDRVGYLFGYPIAHSLSPLFHQTVYDNLGLNWSMLFLESTDVAHFLQLMRDPKFYGAAVTMPHKVAILQHLDELTPVGRDVGACNTIFLKEADGKRVFVGTNTDVTGIRDSFYFNVKDPDATFHKRPGLVIGGGGAARSAVYALQKHMQCSPIYIVNRDKAEVDTVISECTVKGFGEGLIHVATVEQAEELEEPGAIVACVPNFPPKTEAEWTARRIIQCIVGKKHKGAMLEMCYHPTLRTEIGDLAEEAGWQVILGTEAMIYQGLEQDKLWTGRQIQELPVAKVQQVIAAKLERSNL